MRHTTTVLLLAATLALAGCSSSGDKTAAKPTPSVSPSVDPVVPFMRAVEDAHLTSYATGIPAWQELGVFPPKWCAALDAGHSVAWMFDMSAGGLYPVGEDWGTEKSDAYRVLVLGVKAYCPKHVGVVTSELREADEY